MVVPRYPLIPGSTVGARILKYFMLHIQYFMLHIQYFIQYFILGWTITRELVFKQQILQQNHFDIYRTTHIESRVLPGREVPFDG